MLAAIKPIDTYEDDLRRRLKEAHELISRHEGKKIGPYVITAEFSADTWGAVARRALQFAKAFERGPEYFNGGGGGGDGYYKWRVESGDEINPDHLIFRRRGGD